MQLWGLLCSGAQHTIGFTAQHAMEVIIFLTEPPGDKTVVTVSAATFFPWIVNVFILLYERRKIVRVLEIVNHIEEIFNIFVNRRNLFLIIALNCGWVRIQKGISLKS